MWLALGAGAGVVTAALALVTSVVAWIRAAHSSAESASKVGLDYLTAALEGLKGELDTARADLVRTRAEFRIYREEHDTDRDHYEKLLSEQRTEVLTQKGEIGELRGQLAHCTDERQQMAQRLAALEAKP